MAHTVFMIRGPLMHVTEFIMDLSKKYLKMQMYNPETKKLEDKWLQVRVCPVQLYDVSYPKQYRDAVHNTLFQNQSWEGMESSTKGIRKYLYLVRKALGLQEIKPPKDKDVGIIMGPPQHCEIIGLGTKEDYWTTETGEHVDEAHKTDLSTEGI